MNKELEALECLEELRSNLGVIYNDSLNIIEQYILKAQEQELKLEFLNATLDFADGCTIESSFYHNGIKVIAMPYERYEKLKEENDEYKNVLNALKNYLHILPMVDGSDVIGIGCPTNEDVIEPNDFGYDIIKDWLKKDKSE